MNRLEHTIRSRRQELDHAEPSDGHFEKFQIKLADFHSPQRKRISGRTLLRIAAVILVLITLSFAVNYFNLLPESMVKESAAVDLPPELKDAEIYYTALTDEKLQQIEQLAGSKEEGENLRERALTEVAELESTNAGLQREYAQSGNNERVLDAIANNYRVITHLLDHIINELSSEQKESKTLSPTL